MERFALKIAGASGQGINTVGEIIALGLKRAGYYVFAEREYPSLIKGGHATYQINYCDKPISSNSRQIDIVTVLNKQATKWHLEELKKDGLIIHDIENPRINKEEYELIKNKNIRLVYLPAEELARSAGGNDIMTNIICTGFIWSLFELDLEILKNIIKEKFNSKPEMIDLNLKCLESGYTFKLEIQPEFRKRFIRPDEIENDLKLQLHTFENKDLDKFKLNTPSSNLQDKLLISGSDAMGIGAINAGMKIFYGYPMTPATPLLVYLAENAKQTGIIVKQVEDEITAADMAIGSMHMGVRTLTATSGGGFDLMTEHISFAAMIETPFVCVLAQRPGPATGLPTWTAQGDLLLACFSGHGEFPRCVMAVSDPKDAFYTIQEAFNIAEEFQIPVIVLSDKFVGESIYTVDQFDLGKINIDRGKLITDSNQLTALKSTDRYKLTEDGISPRWLPGDKAADYNANSDEHDEEGNVTEEAEMSARMISKRQKKLDSLYKKLPDPEILYNNVDLQNAKGMVSLVGWGSTYAIIQDVMKFYEEKNIKVDYLNLKYLWPLKTDVLSDYLGKHPETILIENNHDGQLGKLIKMQTGIEIKNKFLKWNGRQFYFEEIIEYIDGTGLLGT